MKQTEIIRLNVNNNEISIKIVNGVDYISLTDLAKYQNSIDPSFTIKNWLRKISTIEFLGLWEKLFNTNFNLIEFDQIKKEYGHNSFSMSPTQWQKRTKAIGIISKGGKYSIGTFAHPDIAFEFASWLSPEFKLYLIKEFERLKKDESYNKKIEWTTRRIISKTNYLIQTESIKDNLIPYLNKNMIRRVYADEADVLNVALFGVTAQDWRKKNKNLKGNIRDYASLEQLLVLSNLEVLNSEMIKEKIVQKERLLKLNQIAIKQIEILNNNINCLSK